jgi:3-methyl-2-oxobutanoate hydroxymethyltransferase
VAQLITQSVPVPTIGIGAGPYCDGQILVLHDMAGMSSTTPARFVRRYADLGQALTQAAASFAADIRSGSYPSEKESYPTPPELERALGERPMPQHEVARRDPARRA